MYTSDRFPPDVLVGSDPPSHRKAPPATMGALTEENRHYEARFGHVFLISASERSAAEILAELRRRMSNDPATEIEVAAAEHRKITRIRLERMLNE